MGKTPGERLQEARAAAGFSGPAEAAEHFEWNTNTYKSHENGIRGLRPGPARKYARAFGVSHVWLLTGIDPKAPLSPEEIEMMEDYRALSEREREQARRIVRALHRSPRETA